MSLLQHAEDALLAAHQSPNAFVLRDEMASAITKNFHPTPSPEEIVQVLAFLVRNSFMRALWSADPEAYVVAYEVTALGRDKAEQIAHNRNRSQP